MNGTKTILSNVSWFGAVKIWENFTRDPAPRAIGKQKSPETPHRSSRPRPWGEVHPGAAGRFSPGGAATVKASLHLAGRGQCAQCGASGKKPRPGYTARHLSP